MSNYKSLMETNPTPNNPLVALTTKIEELIASERFEVALSALVSAALRLETAKCWQPSKGGRAPGPRVQANRP
jgi:hypothetical protein